MTNKWTITSKDGLSNLVRKQGLHTWKDLLFFIKNLPYGRNANRTDLKLVLLENKGTCSSKHALLKQVADLNEVPNIELVMGIYKMNKINTPKIGNVLTHYHLKFIPEAHCYLRENGLRTDYTNSESDIKNIEKDLLEEIEIQPNQVADFKVEYHKRFISEWLSKNKIDLSFSDVWAIRETCIAKLAK